MTADREAGEPSNVRGFKFQSEENRGTGLKSVVFLVVLLVDVFFYKRCPHLNVIVSLCVSATAMAPSSAAAQRP